MSYLTRGSVALALMSGCGGDSSSTPTPDAATSIDATIISTISATVAYDWAFGGAGHPIGGGGGRYTTWLRFAAANATGWAAWEADGELLTFGDGSIQTATMKLEGGFPTLKWTDAANAVFQLSLLSATLPLELGNDFDLDVVRSVGGIDNTSWAFGSKAGVISYARENNAAVAVTGPTSDNFFFEAHTCMANAFVLSPRRADAGLARMIRADGSTMFAATAAGAASCKGDRMVMDGKLYSVQGNDMRTELVTLTTSEIESLAWTSAGNPVFVESSGARMVNRSGSQLGSEAGVVGRLLPELVSVNVTDGGTFTLVDDVALRFDPEIAANDTGEFRITGHDDGNVVLAIGDAIVSGSGDSVIVQDKATGLFRDDRDTSFGVSSVAVQGERVAIAQRLVNSTVQLAALNAGELLLDTSITLTGATSPAHVAWSASGDRLAIAYHVGGMLRVEVRNLAGTPTVELTHEVAADAAVVPALAWDRTDERLAIGTGTTVSLWMPGQATPSPSITATVERLAWGPAHALAIGNATGVTRHSLQLEPVGATIPVAGDFAWSPTDRLAIVDAAGIRIVKGDAITDQVTLTVPARPGQLPKEVRATRVAWVDDDHLVVVTDRGFVARYTLTLVE